MFDNPFLLDLAWSVVDVTPSDDIVEPLRFAEGVLASVVSADYRPRCPVLLPGMPSVHAACVFAAVCRGRYRLCLM